jgi:hypothetical protein
VAQVITCDVCKEHVQKNYTRRPIGIAGIVDICSGCEEVIKMTLDLISWGPWGDEVRKLHKKFYELRSDSANND